MSEFRGRGRSSSSYRGGRSRGGFSRGGFRGRGGFSSDRERGRGGGYRGRGGRGDGYSRGRGGPPRFVSFFLKLFFYADINSKPKILSDLPSIIE